MSQSAFAGYCLEEQKAYYSKHAAESQSAFAGYGKGNIIGAVTRAAHSWQWLRMRGVLVAKEVYEVYEFADAGKRGNLELAEGRYFNASNNLWGNAAGLVAKFTIVMV